METPESMEMDGGSSSTSNDSQEPNSAMNFYSDNLFFATNGKLDNGYFSSNEKFRKSCDSRRFQYCPGNVTKFSKCPENEKNGEKSFFASAGSREKSGENVVLKVDAFGKKAVSFSPDQVRKPFYKMLF